MKKATVLFLTIMMVFTLAACGGKDDPAPSGGNDAPPAASGQTEQPSTPPKDNFSQGTDNEVNVTVSQYTLADMDNDNWAEVVKDVCGVELIVPEGWDLSEASGADESYGSIGFTNFNSESSESFEAYGEKLFAACQAASTDGSMEPSSFAGSETEEAGKYEWRFYPSGMNGDGETISHATIKYYPTSGIKINLSVKYE